jgi:hypothetical protein
MRRAFTVIELLVAVVVLLAVIIATSKIFNTASKVSSTGEANADVLQQGTVIEEQLRRDLQRICRDGFMAIQCVEVPNDVNVAAGGPLLNPQLPKTATLRCDQLVFFTAGSEISARWAGPGDLAASGGGQQARTAMVRYGHGIQLPRLTAEVLGASTAEQLLFPPVIVDSALTTGAGSRPLLPWAWRSEPTRAVRFRFGSSGPTAGNAPTIDPNQPEARQWVLARKSTLLADDGGFAVFYPEPQNFTTIERLGPSSAPAVFGDLRNSNGSSLLPVGNAYRRFFWRELSDRGYLIQSQNIVPSPLLQSGWVDIAASDLDQIRRQIAPTLRLGNPLDVGNLTEYVQSVTPPWFNGSTSAGIPAGPKSWPVGSAAPAWPAIEAVSSDGGNIEVGSVERFSSQRDRIMRACFGTPADQDSPAIGLLGWPRAEKSVPDTDRRSEMLVSPTLVGNCSSFRIDWTWEPQTGRQTDSSGAIIGRQVRELPNGDLVPVRVLTGLGYDETVPGNVWLLRGFEPFAVGPWPQADPDPPFRIREQPWFGLPSTAAPGVTLAQRSVQEIARTGNPAEVANKHMRFVAESIEGIATETDPQHQEPSPDGFPGAVKAPFPGFDRVRVYTAVFGFNQDEAYVVTPDGTIVLRDDYTPWPTQIRITATIHDPRLVLDRGREFQFVINVPKRRKD